MPINNSSRIISLSSIYLGGGKFIMSVGNSSTTGGLKKESPLDIKLFSKSVARLSLKSAISASYWSLALRRVMLASRLISIIEPIPVFGMLKFMPLFIIGNYPLYYL